MAGTDIRATTQRLRALRSTEFNYVAECLDGISSNLQELRERVAAIVPMTDITNITNVTNPQGDADGVITAGHVTISLDAAHNYTVLLDVPTTEIDEPVKTTAIDLGEELQVTFIQDVDGGRGVTWNSIFRGLSAIQPDPRVDTMTVFQFKFRLDGQWWLSGYLAIG